MKNEEPVTFAGEPPLMRLFPHYHAAMLALGRSANALRTVKCDVRKLGYFSGKTDISAVTPKQLQAFQVWLSKTPLPDQWGHRIVLSLGTRARLLAYIRSFLR